MRRLGSCVVSAVDPRARLCANSAPNTAALTPVRQRQAVNHVARAQQERDKRYGVHRIARFDAERRVDEVSDKTSRINGQRRCVGQDLIECTHMLVPQKQKPSRDEVDFKIRVTLRQSRLTKCYRPDSATHGERGVLRRAWRNTWPDTYQNHDILIEKSSDLFAQGCHGCVRICCKDVTYLWFGGAVFSRSAKIWPESPMVVGVCAARHIGPFPFAHQPELILLFAPKYRHPADVLTQDCKAHNADHKGCGEGVDLVGAFDATRIRDDGTVCS